jgi:hypothetical protein
VQPASPDDRSAAPSGKLVDAAVMAERRALRAELAEQTLQQRAAAAERAVVSMEARLTAAEGELAEARAERDALAGELLERERELRLAGQRQFAERMVRGELEQELVAERRTADAELALLREHVDVLAAEAEHLEGVAERARRDAVVAKRRLAGEREAGAAAAAEAELVRRQVARRLDAVQETLAGLHDELDDRVVAERGRAALALARERELWEAAVETERRRADAERAARHRAEAELVARVVADAGPVAELGAIRAIDLRGLSRPPSAHDQTVAVAETVIADLARAADRLRAQVEAGSDDVDAGGAGPEARRRHRRWWAFPWRRSLPVTRARD